MGKASKWLRSLLTGRKEKATGSKPCPLPLEMHSGPVFSVPSNPREKRRWSFRRSTARDSSSSEQQAAALGHSDSEVEEKRHARAMTAITATAMKPKSAVPTRTNAAEVAGADAAQAAAAVLLPKSASANGINAAETTAAGGTFAAAQAAVMQLKSATTSRTNAAEVGAAIKIQAVFRSYLARKALCALKGLVKLQALVRGHLVRKQAAATLRCMQALVRLQARARVQRIQMLGEARQQQPPSPPCDRRPPQYSCRRCFYEMDKSTEEDAKIVEMDLGEACSSLRSTSSYSVTPTKRDVEYLQQYGCGHVRSLYKSDGQQQFSPVSSAVTDASPRPFGRALGESPSLSTAQDSPQQSSSRSAHDGRRSSASHPPAATGNVHHLFFPNYMANTESSRAKVRSQSEPKRRPADAYERPPNRRRTGPAEGTRGVPRSSRMQRSSSHVGSSADYYCYPWRSSIKLDRSNVSLMESECGSTSTVLSKAICYDYIN